MEIQQGNERAVYGNAVLEKIEKKIRDELGNSN